MNNGVFLDDGLQNPTPTNFCAGVAGYPEKHFEAMNLKQDLKYLKNKIDAGAEFIVTQMFFDNQKFFAFVDACREMGINVPIIPGIKPLTTMRHLTFIPKIFAVDFPDKLADQLTGCKTNEDVRKVGTEWAIKQSQELVEYGVPCLHYYTMGRSKVVTQILREVFV